MSDTLWTPSYLRGMAPPEQRIGQVLGGKYRLEEFLALGGMGLVYGARHVATGRSVAVKLLRPELAARPDLVRRVSAEARLAVEASHPNVVDVLDTGADELDIPYLVLERLYGQPLDALLEQPLSLITATQALVPVMNALTALHRLGIVHRDIKPSNIFLSSDDDGRITPKLLDFGIAKALASAGSTLSGVALGTPAYMAPEQALGGNAVGPVTDVWSMGVVFARCLTGRLPFDGLAARGGWSMRAGLRPEDLPGVAEPVAVVLARALQLEPLERPATMVEFRTALLAALHEVDAGENWPSEVSVSYARRESELAAALAEISGIVKRKASTGDEGAAGARARARHVLTRTLSTIWRKPLRWRASVLRAALALVALGATAWALQESRGGRSGETTSAALLSEEAFHAETPPVSPTPSTPAAALASSAPDPTPHAVEPSALLGSSSHTPSSARARTLRREPRARTDEAAPFTRPPAEPDAPAEPSTAVAPARPLVGANRSPIIE